VPRETDVEVYDMLKGRENVEWQAIEGIDDEWRPGDD